jgi:hypothetical protein
VLIILSRVNPQRLAPPLLLLVIFAAATSLCRAQDNYEIQVYGSDLVPPTETMVEIHSNFTAVGRKGIVDGLLPTHHAEHETLEITHGFSDWFETGFYVFSSIQPDGSWQWVGDHIRPRVRIPEKWKWPVGLSLSTEFGYQRRAFSVDTWTWELRPIVDRQLGPWYFAFNGALEKSVHGQSVHQGFEFAPAAKIGYNFSKSIAGGLEYYGAVGPVFGWDSLGQQEHQIFPSIDLNVSPVWEINFGVGVGLTHSTDRLIIKTIIGRRFSWPSRKVRASKQELP